MFFVWLALVRDAKSKIFEWTPLQPFGVSTLRKKLKNTSPVISTKSDSKSTYTALTPTALPPGGSPLGGK